MNGISFNFFVHGENIVCATVSVQRQPTLFRLSRRHLDLGKKQPVILGPWSMRAVLLPEQPRIVDSTTPILQHQPPTPQCGMFQLISLTAFAIFPVVQSVFLILPFQTRLLSDRLGYNFDIITQSQPFGFNFLTLTL